MGTNKKNKKTNSSGIAKAPAGVEAYLSLVTFAHTIFAMPFAIIGFALGLKASNFTTYKPWWELLALVVLCMIFARSAAMAFNRWLEDQVQRNPPPAPSGRRIKIRYGTQVNARPPTFALFGNQLDKLPLSYQRYLMNGLRDTLGLEGTPIRFHFRGGRVDSAPSRARRGWRAMSRYTRSPERSVAIRAGLAGTRTRTRMSDTAAHRQSWSSRS